MWFGIACSFRSYAGIMLESWYNLLITTPVLPFLIRKSEQMQPSEPQACVKSELLCAHWNNSYGYMIPNSRNTTYWSLQEIVLVSHCALESRCGHHSAMGNLSELSSSPLTLFTFWSATPSPIIPVQMDVYLDSGPEQDCIVISVKCDSENIALGFHSAGKLQCK